MTPDSGILAAIIVARRFACLLAGIRERISDVLGQTQKEVNVMRKGMLTLAVLGMLVAGGAQGDITLNLTNMDDTTLSGTGYGNVWGWSEGTNAWFSLSKAADQSGVVKWTDAELSAAAHGGLLHYNINGYYGADKTGPFTSVYQDGGFWGQFMTYGGTDTYTLWTTNSTFGLTNLNMNGANSTAEYALDLGNHLPASDEWLGMYFSTENPANPWNPPSTGGGQAKPTFRAEHLTARGYTFQELDIQGNGWMNLHITNDSGYDETFVVWKDPGGTYTAYLPDANIETGASYDGGTDTFTGGFNATLMNPGQSYYPEAWVEWDYGTKADDLYAYVSTGYFNGMLNPLSAPVPEPASMAILGMGLVGLVATRMRKRQSV